MTDFKHGTVWKLLIASYETLRKFAGELAGTCDMLVRALSPSPIKVHSMPDCLTAIVRDISTCQEYITGPPLL